MGVCREPICAGEKVSIERLHLLAEPRSRNPDWFNSQLGDSHGKDFKIRIQGRISTVKRPRRLLIFVMIHDDLLAWALLFTISFSPGSTPS